MSTLRDRVIEEHISRNYPNSQILNYNDADTDLVFYTAEELQAVEEDWFPLCCYKDQTTGKAVYGGRKKVFHTYTEGETGAGKTTRFVMQSLRALSSMRVKPSFVIVDIHGEIIENLYDHFKENGYEIKILNCDNPLRSDTYNPFSELARECRETLTINNDAINKIRRISEIIQPVESRNDPIWDQGARSYTNGCILDKFEDLIEGNIPEECLTIYNVIQNHYWLREKLSRGPGSADLFKIPHYNKKGTNALSTQKMISVTNNAEKTRASYFGVVENHYDAFGQPSLYSLSSSNTIDITDFMEKPTVIVIQSGSTKIGDDLISLLMNDIYTRVVKEGKNSPSKRLPRNIHCFLDEFANCNIADGPEYIKMLTTSRKFGMFWHMILQCDAQLDRKYDEQIGRIIRANSTEIFMGSHDYETEVRFAKSCGQKTIESLSSTIAQQDPRLEVVDLMTPERLNLTEEGYVYIKSNRHPLTRSYIEAFYNCEEFASATDIDAVYPHNRFDYQQTSFYPDDLPPEISTKEYEVLRFVKAQKRSLQELTEQFASYDVKKIVRTLSQKHLVELLDDQVVRASVTKRHFDIYTFREEIAFGQQITAQEVVPPPPKNAFVANSSNESLWGGGQTRNPFNFDEPSDTDKDAEEENSEDFEKWLLDEIPENPMLVDLREHYKNHAVSLVMGTLVDITMVPEFLLEAVGYFSLSAQEQEKTTITFPDNPNIMKFEIIERFIQKNDFVKKAEWDRAMQREYRILKTAEAFPESILQQFANAVREVKDELTLGNIREIKKIISDTE